MNKKIYVVTEKKNQGESIMKSNHNLEKKFQQVDKKFCSNTKKEKDRKYCLKMSTNIEILILEKQLRELKNKKQGNRW